MKANIFIFFFIIIFISGCATVKVPVATGGSRADGVIEMFYEYGIFEKPQVQWDQALVTAKERCKAWGYEDAEAFGGSTSKCQSYDSYGSCVWWLVTIKYQCIDSK